MGFIVQSASCYCIYFTTLFSFQTSKNGQLQFFFNGPPDAASLFQINPTTGAISNRISLLGGSKTYQFTVGVRDMGNPSKSAIATVTINVIEVGKITFPQGEYAITKPENEPVGSLIFNQQATDPLAGVSIQHGHLDSMYMF